MYTMWWWIHHVIVSTPFASNVHHVMANTPYMIVSTPGIYSLSHGGFLHIVWACVYYHYSNLAGIKPVVAAPSSMITRDGPASIFASFHCQALEAFLERSRTYAGFLSSCQMFLDIFQHSFIKHKLIKAALSRCMQGEEISFQEVVWSSSGLFSLHIGLFSEKCGVKAGCDRPTLMAFLTC